MLLWLSMYGSTGDQRWLAGRLAAKEMAKDSEGCVSQVHAICLIANVSCEHELPTGSVLCYFSKSVEQFYVTLAVSIFSDWCDS